MSGPMHRPPETVPELPPAEVRRRAQAGELALVDVREAAEWDAGRAPEAVRVPLTELDERWDDVAAAAGGRPVAFVCRVGQRSALATLLARRHGLEAVNVAGGMAAWAAAGLPLEPEDGWVA